MIERFGDGRDWFYERRLGLFVHWGLYAVTAWHEQEQWRRGVSRRDYGRLIDRFNPVRFDPEAWLDLAQAAGMEYITFTTKHHDGFCLWDTDQTDFKVTRSPYGRDVLRLLADACHRRGVPLCLYYSVVDWRHPNYPNQGRSHELSGPQVGDDPDLPAYLAFLKAQVRELCTRYGEIHGFWWDMNVTGVEDTAINAMIRELQPNAVINNRGFDAGDFGTPERDYDEQKGEVRVYDRLTEHCQSIGRESWGYRADEDYYAERHLMQSIADALGKGANYLLNVGPRADGAMPAEAERMLRRIGAWYHGVREAFEGADPVSDLIDNRDVLLTRRGDTFYVILARSPYLDRVLLRPFQSMPKRSVLLNTGAEVEARVEFVPTQFLEHGNREPHLRLRALPVNQMTDTVLVIRLEFDGPPAIGVHGS
ncbi:MAG: glycoside hydrolase [Chloroflexi bacterium]|nr:glycoside hydrolase [Chloroflexota bacterium]